MFILHRSHYNNINLQRQMRNGWIGIGKIHLYDDNARILSSGYVRGKCLALSEHLSIFLICQLWLFPIVPICSVRLVLKKAVRAQGSACNELESSRGRRALQLCSSERYRLWQHCARHMRPCVHQSFHALCLEVLRCHTFMVNLDPYSETWTRTWGPGLLSFFENVNF